MTQGVSAYCMGTGNTILFYFYVHKALARYGVSAYTEVTGCHIYTETGTEGYAITVIGATVLWYFNKIKDEIPHIPFTAYRVSFATKQESVYIGCLSGWLAITTAPHWVDYCFNGYMDAHINLCFTHLCMVVNSACIASWVCVIIW